MSSDTAFSAEWARCASYLEAALERDGMHSIGDVLSMVLSGDAIFVPGAKSALVYQIIEYPRGKSIRYWLAGGDLEELQHMEKVISGHARALGCTSAEILGRRGWVKSLEGYEEAATVMRRAL